MSVFEAGPWDKKEIAQGAHVFGRKLLYGAEHDSAEHLPEGADASKYGVVELHKLHDFWRRNAIKMMMEQVRRAPKGDEVRLRKVAARSGPATWPGDLGKHHTLIEEMIKLGVVTLHQDDSAQVYAKIYPRALNEAFERYCASAPAPSAASVATPAERLVAAAQSEPFLPAAAFAGARPGYVFKAGARGVGYYADGVLAASVQAAAPLPDGWVRGHTPEGYLYYWHHETSTSSWERPSGPPCIERRVDVAAHAAAALRADGDGRTLTKLEEQSGATISLVGAGAVLRGTTKQVARAQQLLERKIDALAFAARALGSAHVGSAHVATGQPAAHEATTTTPNYDFTSVAGYVAQADACRDAIRRREAQPAEHAAKRQAVVADAGGALAALAAYGEDDSEEDAK